jgi:hypothetical protein
MGCYLDWGRRCLKTEDLARLNNSVLGATELYTFMCQDPTFKRNFLAHGDCYRRISRKWDACARSFIAALKTFFTPKDFHSTQICW